MPLTCENLKAEFLADYPEYVGYEIDITHERITVKILINKHPDKKLINGFFFYRGEIPVGWIYTDGSSSTQEE